MNLLKEKFYYFFREHSRSVLGGGFLMMFISAFAHGLGYNAIGFWFLVATNWVALSLYLLEREKADKRQREIDRYIKNKKSSTGWKKKSELLGGVSLCVWVSSQIWDVNILILPLKNGSNVLHEPLPFIEK